MDTPTPADQRFWLKSGWAPLGALALAFCAALAVVHPIDPHALLLNATPSEPLGLYVRSRGSPTLGRLIAFLAPAGAFPYADRHLAYLHRTPLLKAVAAGPGDLVCTTDGVARINGQPLAPIALKDRDGRALPHWHGCRRLRSSEIFALADRVANSFDSRYFGPISSAAVIGVYRPLLVLKD